MDDLHKLFQPIDVAASPPEAAAPRPPPTLAAKAASFTTSIARFAAGGFQTVSHEVYQARFAHCLPCEQYDLGMRKLWEGGKGVRNEWHCRA
jgi:hypothetical protein